MSRIPWWWAGVLVSGASACFTYSFARWLWRRHVLAGSACPVCGKGGGDPWGVIDWALAGLDALVIERGVEFLLACLAIDYMLRAWRAGHWPDPTNLGLIVAIQLFSRKLSRFGQDLKSSPPEREVAREAPRSAPAGRGAAAAGVL